MQSNKCCNSYTHSYTYIHWSRLDFVLANNGNSLSFGPPGTQCNMFFHHFLNNILKSEFKNDICKIPSCFVQAPLYWNHPREKTQSVNDFTEHASLCLISPGAGSWGFTLSWEGNFSSLAHLKKSVERRNNNIFSNKYNYHIEAETTCPPFYKQLFQIFHFYLNFTVHFKYVPKVPIDSRSALVHIMVRHQAGNRPLSKIVMASPAMYMYLLIWEVEYDNASQYELLLLHPINIISLLMLKTLTPQRAENACVHNQHCSYW